MNVLVVGAGAMGRWFADAVRADDVGIAFADPDDAAASAAADAVDGRAVPLDTDESFTAVCIAVPIPVAVEAIATHADRAERALIDVTGVAAEPVAAMREHAPDRERLSLHPLFAPENEPGNVAAVVDAAGSTTDAVRDALTARGNDVFETTADEHDRAMETVQAKTHAAVLAFGLAADPVPEEFQTPISTVLFDLLEQVTGGDARVYADIQDAFDGAEDVAAAAEELAATDADAFGALYDRAGDHR
ncbi:prephenate dehydrogenase [Halorientalis sp. IM1011]|uniref:prephenate dehydrogenase/arogenate dehydrogenase family protein n=1 Tax=Halorientalis sp. IM1011 TaxID=1932360 RepID=UPI00097CC3A0|nr:prephenate dehydrogenase/arogenate dehydrogenase family protein [Halorientalis sp. IM1011]AQL43917.1 prephenate dehydrogenase [Halorientalis sp. IM1011]